MRKIAPEEISENGRFGLALMIARADDFIFITEGMHREIVSAQKFLLESALIEEKFDIVLENYYDFERELLEISLRHMLFDVSDDIFSGVTASINRRVLNYLTATTMYFDHLKRHFVQLFGRGSPEAAAFEEHSLKVEDDNAGYFLLNYLRNFSQHAGHAVIGVSVGTTSRRIGPESVSLYETKAVIDFPSLMSDRKGGEEIKARESDLIGRDIQDLLRHAMDGLSSVHENLRSIVAPKLERCVGATNAAVATFEAGSRLFEEPYGLATVELDDLGRLVTSHYLMLRQMKRHREFVRKNRSLDNLCRRRVIG